MEEIDMSAELEGFGYILGKIYNELKRANRLKVLELKGKSHMDNIDPDWVDEVMEED